MITIDGPLGPFRIPESAHPRTAEVCEQLSRQVFNGEYDDPGLPQELLGWGGDPAVVIDIGASWGPFVVWAMKKWPGIAVIAFEPHAEAADVLVENTTHALISGNGYVELFRRAVTTDPAPKMNGAEDWGAHHIAAADDTCAWPVEGFHPRDLPPCDVLKVDCEGAEIEVLSEYPHLATCCALLIEWHSPEKRDRVREIAIGAGFQCLRETPDPATYGISLWVKA